MKAANEAPGRPVAWLLAPLLLYAYPVLYALASRSKSPDILGRYSKAFFAFNLWNVALVLLTLYAWRRGGLKLLALAYVLIVIGTALVPANSQLLEMPGLSLIMPVIRLLCGGAIVFAGFLEARRASGKVAPLALSLGAVLIFLSMIDLTLLGVLSLRPAQDRSLEGFRVEQDSNRATDDDIVLIGDSFVWGQGVEVAERMGDRLQAIRAPDSPEGRVLSLGVRGTDLSDYAKHLRDMPPDSRAEVVVIAFYMNDMPAPTTARNRAVNLLKSFGQSFASLRFVADHLARIWTPDVDAYHDFVIGCYEPAHPTFGPRWQRLEDQVAATGGLAVERSRQTPLFLIIPLMVDYAEYPLTEAHDSIAALAERAGFEVIDLLPRFRQDMGDGTPYRAAPNDNHFDARVHAAVAGVLHERLEQRRPSP